MNYSGQGNKPQKNAWGIASPKAIDFYDPNFDIEGGNPMMGGGGSGGGMSFRAQNAPNQLDQSLAYAVGKPGEFKMATDQYAGRYSDQLDEMALEELKQKYPDGPKNGGTWEQEFVKQAADKAAYLKTGILTAGPETQKLVMNKIPSVFSGGPLSGAPSRNRDGITAPSVTKFINKNKGVSPGAGGSRTYGGIPGGGTRYGGRYGL